MTSAQQFSACPECRSSDVYRYKQPVGSSTFGDQLLPKLASGRLSEAKMLPVVCANCGYIRFFADSDARSRLTTSSDWMRV